METEPMTDVTTAWEFHTEPLKHQLDEWYEHKETKARGIFWDMGTGKTKLILDNAVWLFLQDKIDGLFVLALCCKHRICAHRLTMHGLTIWTN